jgi:hypothetical protein
MLTTEVARRLEQRLGLGGFPMVRRRMYARLQRMAIAGGDAVLKVIAELLQEADGPKIRDKGQYFCWVVKRRLAENGFPWDGPTPAGVTDPNQPPSAPPHVPPHQVVKQLGETLHVQYSETREQVQADLKAQLEKRHRDEVIARLRANAANNPEAL